MKSRLTAIDGVLVVETTPHQDHRGSFYRAFCDQDLQAQVGGARIRQASVSQTSARGALRGLHFQYPPQAETKFVRCLRGKVFDVAVDLRQGSPTFLHWHAQELSADNRLMLVIPPGCAHGFQTLEENSELLYLHTAPYCRELEGGVRHDDPLLKIVWPLTPVDLSDRDLGHPLLAADYAGIRL